MTQAKARRQCTAKAKSTGERCTRAPIKGASVCYVHGGAAPQVRKSAKERLAELVEPALEGLHAALKSEDLSQIVRAATVVLDRCGFHPSRSIEVFGKEGAPAVRMQHTFRPISEVIRALSPAARAELLHVIETGQSQTTGGATPRHHSPAPHGLDTRARVAPLPRASSGCEPEPDEVAL